MLCEFNVFCFDFFFVFIIAVSGTSTELNDIRIFKAAAEVFRVLLDNSFAIDRLLSYKGSAFRNANLGSILFGFSDTLADA